MDAEISNPEKTRSSTVNNADSFLASQLHCLPWPVMVTAGTLEVTELEQNCLHQNYLMDLIKAYKIKNICEVTMSQCEIFDSFRHE